MLAKLPVKVASLQKLISNAIIFLEFRDTQDVKPGNSGEVAPPGCHVARYQASGKKHRYWYYQLRATEAIFPKTNTEHEFSRYQHLGKAGSVPHIDGVQAVVRRGQIEVLTQAIEALKESWLDLYSNEKKAGHRVE